ncbi:uncharacterized protein LOC100837338 isoform X2 [Brachypodium distachyon]|nr:uncharacterized protein LOC100837338 isoform X2 [Brachypodium distachyon]XP_024313794.1 uncharacterized protein LOC100837338 isoform X2 [Brachypodium distachyon]KQK19373.1 hypothetical protein BRADI_1g47950v3 [Brachypodium distachyon]KQK19381.1 hypothetical protein BRADI_1g47950v3 [Brachypodium distachyon]|eukprot:XP_014752730.1 uncharacterized protein LOC100837338 isoform X2 [Brachypodium distachyon]
MNFWMGKVHSKSASAYDGAIFLCNCLTRKECFERKLFGLSSLCADFVQQVKAGATLFLYDVEQRKLHGVFEATSDGAMNIIPDAYISSGSQFPSQIRFKRIWFCKPLMQSEFQDVLHDNYFSWTKFSYGLSHQQVVNLLHLFSSRNRLQPRQNPRSQDEPPRESEFSSVINQTDNLSGSNSISHGSLKSPCQTCTSSTVGEHAAPPRPDISDVAKSNNSRSSLPTRANTDIVTVAGSEKAIDDNSTDDFIPLQLEEDNLDGVDYLSDLLEDESHSSESKSCSDSEEHVTFHQPCDRKKSEYHPPMANSKLRSDNEDRKSVFARLMGRPRSFSQREKSKINPFSSKNVKSFSPLSRRKKRRRTQQNKPFPCDNRGTLDMPSADKMRRIPALDYSFVWDDDRRYNKFSGGKPSNIQTSLHPFVREDVNKLDLFAKEPDRHEASKKLFVAEGSGKLIESCNRELNKSPVFAEVHERCEVTVKETRTPFLDFKRRSKDPNVGGHQDFDTVDIEKDAKKKMRLASASFHQEEYQSDTASVLKDTQDMDILAISDGSCKLKSISLSSKDTCSQVARAYFETDVPLQDEQQQSIQGCSEEVIGVKSLILEDSGTADLLPMLSFGNRQTSPNVETRSELASGHVETEKSPQEKEYQSAGSCHVVFNIDKMLLSEKPETIDFLSNHDKGCGSKMRLSSDGNNRHVASSHLVAEMPLPEKENPSVQSYSQVVHGVAENSEELFPKFDANCGRNKSLSCDGIGGYVASDLYSSDASPDPESPKPLSNFPKYHGDSAKKNISSDGILEMVATDHQETCMLPLDVSTGDGDSEPKTSFYEKDAEATHSPTASEDREDTTYTPSPNGRRSNSPPYGLELSKAVPQPETRYQIFRSGHKAGHENTDTDSSAVCAEGYGSKSGMSTDSTCGYLAVADGRANLLGTSSESRTSFFDGSSSDFAQTIRFAHDPGEEMEPH